MPYQLVWSEHTKKDLKHIDKKQAARIIKKIEATLTHSPKAGEVLQGEWHGYYRYRIGNYRVIYTIDHEQIRIIIVKIGHRREVYAH